jgi:hypothetical protein
VRRDVQRMCPGSRGRAHGGRRGPCSPGRTREGRLGAAGPPVAAQAEVRSVPAAGAVVRPGPPQALAVAGRRTAAGLLRGRPAQGGLPGAWRGDSGRAVGQARRRAHDPLRRDGGLVRPGRVEEADLGAAENQLAHGRLDPCAGDSRPGRAGRRPPRRSHPDRHRRGVLRQGPEVPDRRGRPRQRPTALRRRGPFEEDRPRLLRPARRRTLPRADPRLGRRSRMDRSRRRRTRPCAWTPSMS